MPAGGLTVADNHNLLGGIVAEGEHDDGGGERGHDIHGSLNRLHAIQNAEEFTSVRDRGLGQRERYRSAHNQAESNASVCLLDISLCLFACTLEVCLSALLHVHGGGAVNDDYDIALRNRPET